MEEAKKKLKVYCETSFWSWLVSRPSTDPDHAIKQAWTRKWWEEAAPKCEIHVSEHVRMARPISLATRAWLTASATHSQSVRFLTLVAMKYRSDCQAS